MIGCRHGTTGPVRALTEKQSNGFIVVSEGNSIQSDTEWLESVFDRLEGPLLAYCGRLVAGDFDRAQDCVQEAFLRLCKASRGQVESYVDAWLFKTCRNIAMDLHRQESQMVRSIHELAIDQIAPSELDPQLALAAKEQRESLEASIGRLPVLEKEAVLLRLGQGLSYKQIAEVMELSVSHVGVLLHQALGKLRATMNPDRRSQS